MRVCARARVPAGAAASATAEVGRSGVEEAKEDPAGIERGSGAWAAAPAVAVETGRSGAEAAKEDPAGIERGSWGGSTAVAVETRLSGIEAAEVDPVGLELRVSETTDTTSCPLSR
eukprot:tig00001484_g8916.t1